MATKFYQFRQNNSGGTFDSSEADGIGWLVVIEATSAGHANDRAERIGLYFDGCNDGRDCSCCGDRWCSAYGDGDDVPSVYRMPLEGSEYESALYWGLPAFVHYLGAEGVVRYPRIGGAK